MRTNIFAYTPAGNANPAYISVNREDDDRLTVAVRSNGAPTASFIEMPRDELANLAAAIGAYLEATAPAEVEPAPVEGDK
jgi:hypothetical protein